jgi:hypothetical protein
MYIRNRLNKGIRNPCDQFGSMRHMATSLWNCQKFRPQIRNAITATFMHADRGKLWSTERFSDTPTISTKDPPGREGPPSAWWKFWGIVLI